MNPLFPTIFPASLLLFFLAHTNPNRAKKHHSLIAIEKMSEKKFISIFDGKTLNQWEGDSTYWRVEEGAITGEVKPNNLLQNNSFIIWKGGAPADFELKGEFKISANGNSGINYRSERVAELPYALRGYQADLDGQNVYTGQNYEERKRTTLAFIGQKTTINPCFGPSALVDLRTKIQNNSWTCVTVTDSLGAPELLKQSIKSNKWNRFHLIIKGNRLLHYVNGILFSDVTDNDVLNRAHKGLLGMQVHVGPAMKVQFKNLYLKEL
ncbi:DUF1080 domain-containing protein [Flavobacterium sp.]|uniref:3-keto-disaccharide hydrolase n=1 Tax=Flavobacterium sp. TaxID=239 RepID=UPI00260BCC7F|nr:DUF1080 domain-containing protein [Flavobacterium sp.]